MFESFARNKTWLDRCLIELGRVDLCSEMGIEMGREMGIEREQQIRKMGRERESAYVNGVVERNNKKIEKIDYLNKRDDRVDKLMWVFCKNRCIKYTN